MEKRKFLFVEKTQDGSSLAEKMEFSLDQEEGERLSFCVKPLPSWSVWGGTGAVLLFFVGAFFYVGCFLSLDWNSWGSCDFYAMMGWYVLAGLFLGIFCVGAPVIFYTLVYRTWQMLAPFKEIESLVHDPTKEVFILLYKKWRLLSEDTPFSSLKPIGKEREEPAQLGSSLELVDPVQAVKKSLTPVYGLFFLSRLQGSLEGVARGYSVLLKRLYQGPPKKVFLEYPYVRSMFFGMIAVIVILRIVSCYGFWVKPYLVYIMWVNFCLYGVFWLVIPIYRSMKGMNRIIEDLGSVELLIKEKKQGEGRTF